jgi:RHS repeat-associated protein
MAVNIPKLGASKVYNYHYDQLNRLVAMDAFNGLDVSTGTFVTTNNQLTDYKERISYDPNGNILTYLRNGDAARPAMDDLTYNYTATNNQLDKVTDQALDASPTDYSKYNDIKKFQADHNYKYDLIGNLISDDAEGITGITWDSYGKMISLTRGSSTSNFVYDPSGNRILKVTPTNATAYVRDGSGNVLSVYTKASTGPLTQSEIHLYGSKRLGMVTTHAKQDAVVVLGCGFNNGISRTFTRGEKLFELSNHLGNVLATVTDKKIAFPAAAPSTSIDHYEADITSAQDYYPFGMLQPGRKWNAGGYRYGFNGKENDNDVKGEGNQQDYGMRVYDPRLGKFLSVDPLTNDYPWYTPYQFAGNKPIEAVDLDGAEEKSSIDQLGRSLNITQVMSFWEVRNSITNSYLRFDADYEFEMRSDMFQKLGISDPEVVKNYQLRVRTVEINSVEKACWQCKTGLEIEKTYSREWVLEPRNSAGKELLEAALDVVNIASTLSLAKTSSPSGPVFFAKGGGAIILRTWRTSMSILYNVRRLSSMGLENGLDGVHSLADVMEAGMAFVGNNAKKVYRQSGKFVGWESADGLKRFRPSVWKKKLGKIQANFEQRTSTQVKWDNDMGAPSRSNLHVDTDLKFDYRAENIAPGAGAGN